MIHPIYDIETNYFTESLNRALQVALDDATKFRSEFITPEHLLYAISYQAAFMSFCETADVDIDDNWIDVEKVEQFSSTSKEKDPIHFAIACIDYYGPENFGVAEKTFQYDWKSCTKDDVVEQLRDYIFDWTDMKFDGVPFDLTKLVGTEYVDWLPTCVRDMIKSKLNEYYSGMEDADRSELIDELMDGTFNKMDEITASLPHDRFDWRAITDNLTVCGMRIADLGPSL